MNVSVVISFVVAVLATIATASVLREDAPENFPSFSKNVLNSNKELEIIVELDFDPEAIKEIAYRIAMRVQAQKSGERNEVDDDVIIQKLPDVPKSSYLVFYVCNLLLFSISIVSLLIQFFNW